MNFQDYVTDYPWPPANSKPNKALDYYLRKFPGQFNPAMTHNQLIKEARAIFKERNLALTEQFKQDAFKELGIENHPKRELLYKKAWELGHSGGLSEVWYYLSELADLIID